MALAPQKASRVDANSERLLDDTLVECEQLSARLKDLLRLADALIAVLPLERRLAYTESLKRFLSVARPARPGRPINDNIISIIAENPQVNSQEVCERLISQGFSVDQKQVANALDYLVRRGELERIARGQYRINQRPAGPDGADQAVEDMITEKFGPPTYRGLPPGMKGEPPCY
jgi:hypothetical protein